MFGTNEALENGRVVIGVELSKKLCLIINRQTFVECNFKFKLVSFFSRAKIDAPRNDPKRKELVKQASALQECYSICHLGSTVMSDND
jgi:hypothetical protein